MSIKIGHSSIDENGKIAGGQSGDQTKRETCIREWYNKGWVYVLRPKKTTLAEKSAKACEDGCKNDKVGYDQYQRNSLNTQAKKVNYDLSKITATCECDCSSFMHVCAIAGGAKLTYGSNGVTTRTIVNVFVASGDYDKLSDSKYLTSDRYLKRGDILVKPGSHCVMVLEDGSAVADRLVVDGSWGKDTTKKTQKVLGTTIDGIVSRQKEIHRDYVPGVSALSWEFKSEGYKGGSPTVKAIQTLVNATADGFCGPKTVTAIQTFLADKGYYKGKIDASMGPLTVKAWQSYINDRL